MRDFPVFTTEFGVASLILKEIPYRAEAYIIIQDTLQPEQLLRECISFCAMCGAEKIYARGHKTTEDYPLHCIVYTMRAQVRTDESKIENLWPVTEETVPRWRQLLNERMYSVDNAATLEKKDERKILDSGGAYFVHRNGLLLGAGWVEENELKLLASVQAGMGERVLHTLLSTLSGQEATLDVASTNHRAIRLYEKYGFLKTAERMRWYKVR